MRSWIPLLLSLWLVNGLWGQRMLPLWTASRDGGTDIYLLGSIHVGDDTMFPLDPAIEAAFDASASIAVELDIDIVDAVALQEDMRQRARLPEGESLFELLPSDVWFGADRELNKYKVQLVNYDDVRPWFVIWLVSSMSYADTDYDPDKGIDRYFINKAKREEKPVMALETVEEQIDAFSGGSLEEQVQLLEGTVAQMDAQEMSPDDVMDAWESGDTEALANLLIPAPGQEENAGVAAFWRRLLDERNVRMAERVEAIDARQEEPLLMIVGAMHMVGPEGVVALLRERGYTVEQVAATEETAR